MTLLRLAVGILDQLHSHDFIRPPSSADNIKREAVEMTMISMLLGLLKSKRGLI